MIMHICYLKERDREKNKIKIDDPVIYFFYFIHIKIKFKKSISRFIKLKLDKLNALFNKPAK